MTEIFAVVDVRVMVAIVMVDAAQMVVAEARVLGP